jgi:hypothetical protein
MSAAMPRRSLLKSLAALIGLPHLAPADEPPASPPADPPRPSSRCRPSRR